MSHFHPYVGAVYLILSHPDDKNSILTLKRTGTGNNDGYHSIVAGHMDGNETALNAIIREAKEEVNIDIRESALSFFGIMHRKAPSKSDPSQNVEILDLYFTTSTWKGELYNNEPEKHDDISWCNIDNLPNTMLPFVKEMLESFRNGRIAYHSYAV